MSDGDLRPCPNCGLMLDARKRVCHNCGAVLPPIAAPLPAGASTRNPAHPVGELLTGSRGGDAAVGIIGGILLPIFVGCLEWALWQTIVGGSFRAPGMTASVGLMVGPPVMVWAVLRTRYPILAKAFLIATLSLFALSIVAVAALVLGALLLCAGVLKQFGGGH